MGSEELAAKEEEPQGGSPEEVAVADQETWPCAMAYMLHSMCRELEVHEPKLKESLAVLH